MKMKGNRQFKAVLHSFPMLREHYPFMRRGSRAADNKNMKKKEVSDFLCTLQDEFLCKSVENSDEISLEKFIADCFSASPPSDTLLHLLEDAFIMALIRWLYGHRKDQDKKKCIDFSIVYISHLEKLDFEKIYLTYSAVDKTLSERNFLCYRDCDRESREHIKNGVYRFSKKHKVADREGARLIDRDFFEKRQKRITRTYTALLIVLPILFSAFVFLFCGFIPMLILLLPIFTFSYETVCTIASFVQSPTPILKLESREIEHPVLVTVTVLLTDPKEIHKLCLRLKRMLLQNPEPNISFGLLADFGEHDRPHRADDDDLEKTAVSEIEKLNAEFPERFCLFLRGRIKSSTQKRYMGWERKRGALIELVRLIKGKPTSFKRIVASPDILQKTSYILTLDADTDLSIGAVSKLYATMRHPENLPVVKDGVVVKGYGVLQPRMITTVESAGKSPFSMLMSGTGGTDSYQNAVFDFYQTVFGKGAFCGKGMFDVDVFYQVIDGAFPEGRILSHDLLEGTRLRCGYLSELPLTDSCPSSALSFYNRQHRWLRGDFQTLPFAFRFLPSSEKGKKKTRNPIDTLSKFMIFSNVARAVTPIFSLSALFFSTLLSESTCAVFLLFSFAYLLFPLICNLLLTVRFVGRRFYSTVIQNVWQGLFRTAWALCSLCYSAQLSLDAAVRVLYRTLISGKKLLEWTTAGESDRKYAHGSLGAQFLLYVRKTLPSLLVGVVMLVFSEGGIVRLFALSFILFPLFALLLSRPYKDKKEISEKQRALLLKYASDSFSFFERFVTASDHFLPPDNYQEHPVAALARRTSPTNIALYLTSVVSMHDLGLIDENAMYKRLSDTVGTLLILPKYRGHLYNWYSTETLDILGTPYISTVDSGNLALALLCVKNALNDSSDVRAKNLREDMERLLTPMDFSFLYNEKKELLFIGYDPIEEKAGENCYDLLASEARSAYFYAIATRQIPLSSWRRLGRPVTVRDGHMGILSFSGTAFEFFMPALFLPLYKNTLLYEALCFALFEQERDRTDGIWGRSESCYFAFDDQMNYQYRAFGSQTLALDPTAKEQDVVAPYATFLTLCLSPSMALSNLKKMSERGLTGECGFYEAMDFTASRVGRGSAIIRNYMSHHVGMSITAIANACCDRIFVKRLLSDCRMDAATELLKERVPSDAPISKTFVHKTAKLPRIPFLSVPLQKGSSVREIADKALLYRGSTRVCASGDGKISLTFQDLLLTPPPDAANSFDISVFSGGLHVDLSSCNRFFFDGKRLGYAYEEKSLSFQVRILVSESGIWLFHLEGKGQNPGGTIFFQSPLLFCSSGEYRSHPAFAGLLVESEYLQEEHILLFKKRAAKQGEQEFHLAFAFLDGRPFEFISRADDLPSAEHLAKTKLAGICGPCRKPYVCIRRNFGKESFDLDLLTVASTKRQSALKTVREIRAQNEGKSFFRKMNEQKFLGYPHGERPEKAVLDCCSLLLKGIYGVRRSTISLPCFPIEALWRYAISGDDPIFTFFLPEKQLSESQKKTVSLLLRAHALLSGGGVRCDLVLWRPEEEHYFSPAKKELEELVTSSVGGSRLGKRGGVHLLFDENARRILPSFSTVCLSVDENCILPGLSKQFLGQLETEEEHLTLSVVQCAEKENIFPEILKLPCGSFTEKGFAPDKKRAPFSPYSMIYCSHQFGTLLTDRSLGFTWFRNSGELRLTPFSGDEFRGLQGEKLVLLLENGECDLCDAAQNVHFGRDCATYKGKVQSLEYCLMTGVDDKLPVKLTLLRIKNCSPTQLHVVPKYKILPTLNKIYDGMISEHTAGDTQFFKRTVSLYEHDFGMYLTTSSNEAFVAPGETVTFFYLLGTVNLKNDKCFYHVHDRFKSAEDILHAFERYQKQYASLFSSFYFRTGNGGTDLLLNYFIPYQILTSRIYGRTGFFQPGGAYGFRDQLQDCLSMLPYDPSILRNQLYRSARHQYTEGNVQHWWHRVTALPASNDAGVRTECSDDFLWLPYALSKYLDATNDREIMEKKICYLSSPALEEGKERYERPQKTERVESLYFHCVRAIDLALNSRSERGLCRMGSCDWNDGLSEVRGESVWLTQFLLLTLQKFLPYAIPDQKVRYEEAAKECENALENCYVDGQYLRAFFKNGTPLGKKGDSYCAIDLLPQSFAVFVKKDKKSLLAINRAYDVLWDKERKVFRLFSPSYDHGLPFPGYLGGYCPGFRENGGQYTHAAIWGAMALLRIGEHQKGFEVLEGISPLSHCMTDFKNYVIEPYALAGDVYYAKNYEGRGGWSQYTGSAGWYLQAWLGELLGYTEKGDSFSLYPKLSENFPGFSLKVRKKETVYHIEVLRGEHFSILLDGKEVKNEFLFDKKNHKLKMVLAKKEEIV